MSLFNDFLNYKLVAALGGIALSLAAARFLRKAKCTNMDLSMDGRNIKLIMVVHNGLGMSKGKAAAQCCHAAVDCYKQALRKPQLLQAWERIGQPKVVLKVDNETMLLKIANQASNIGLIVSVISDAGRTQVAAGSKTVVGIGPGPTDQIDHLTGSLKLY